MSSDDRLRSQLLGKDWKRKTARKAGLLESKPRPKPVDVVREESEDEEGRSAIGKIKAKKFAEEPAAEDGEAEEVPESLTERAGRAGSESKRGGSYLDEVLAEHAAKKNKKRKRRKQDSQVANESNMYASVHFSRRSRGFSR